MRTISDTVIILSQELFVTGCQEKANKCVFVAEKLSAPPIVEDTQQLFWQGVQIYQSPTVGQKLWPSLKNSKRTIQMNKFSVFAKSGFLHSEKLHTLHLFANSTCVL